MASVRAARLGTLIPVQLEDPSEEEAALLTYSMVEGSEGAVVVTGVAKVLSLAAMVAMAAAAGRTLGRFRALDTQAEFTRMDRLARAHPTTWQ